jgi:hypothetical protein
MVAFKIEWFLVEVGNCEWSGVVEWRDSELAGSDLGNRLGE